MNERALVVFVLVVVGLLMTAHATRVRSAPLTAIGVGVMTVALAAAIGR